MTVQLGDGDITIDMPRCNIPELDDTAQAMTATARRLDDLVARERSFSADASHQLRMPLAGLRAAIETEIEFPRPDQTEVLHESLVDIDRLEGTIAEVASSIFRCRPATDHQRLLRFSCRPRPSSDTSPFPGRTC